MSRGFDRLLDQLEDGETYENKPPHGPPEEFPSLSEDELERIKEIREGDGRQSSFAHTKLVEDKDNEPHKPKKVEYPNPEQVRETEINSIDGSNTRVGPPAFIGILAKAGLVKFEYTEEKKRKYHETKTIDCSGCYISEGGVFNEIADLYGHTLKTGEDEKRRILPELKDKDDIEPFLMKANEETGNPTSEAMGWGVKFQQTLELRMLKEVDDVPGVTIRDGALLSSSAFEKDTINAMRDYIFNWDEHVLASVSKRVDSSTMLLEALKENTDLRDAWFEDQNITEELLDRISGDSSILGKIVEPGERTPFIEAVNLQRSSLVEEEPALKPVSCYYLTRNRPYEFIKIEFPKLMWENDDFDIERALRLVVWQHELGGEIPLVQEWADNLCQLDDQENILRDKIMLKLEDKGLEMLGDWQSDK
ncbi:MAG: DNA double-strand break repair nuclease NurA [Candidatus Nanohaloarchaea archaeon]